MSAVSNPSGRSSKPIPTLRTLPPEILSHILSFLSATPLSDVSRTSRKLYLAANDDVVWQRLCLQEYDVNPTSYTHFPYERVKSFYVGLLRRWGWLLGFWQANYPFFTGGLLRVQIDPHHPRLIGEKLTAGNVTNDESAFGIQGVMVDHLEVQIEAKQVFEIRFAPTVEARRDMAGLKLGTMLRSEQSTAASAADNWNWMLDGMGLESADEQVHENRYDQEGIWSYVICHGSRGSVTFREHVASVHRGEPDYESARDHFPLFRPSQSTGLWPYPDNSRMLRSEAYITMFDSNEPPIAFNPEEALELDQWHDRAEGFGESRTVMTIDCERKCAQFGCRTVALRGSIQENPAGELRFKTSRFPTHWSKISCDSNQTSPPPRMTIAPKEGIWAGTYGSHGIEFLLLRYEACDAGTDLAIYKITGDVNVPRGEISCRSNLGDGEGFSYIRQGVDDEETVTEDFALSSPQFPPEFHNARSYPGEGTVALAGYRSPQKIKNDVIIISEREIGVFWHALQKVSRFVKLDI